MATTLNALTLRINASTEGVSKAVKAVRSDITRINRIMGQTASATDKMRQAQDSLNRVYQTGAISGADYKRGLDAIQKKYGEATTKATLFSKSTAKIRTALSGGVSTLLAYAAGVASIGAAISSITQSFSQIDLLAKTSDKLGIATDKLAALRFAAEETGVSANKLDMGLQRMVRRVSEAARGTGEAQAALKELGLDAKQLSTLSPDRQFAAIAEAMKGVNSQSDQVRLAFKLFDSEGVALVNTLKLGVDGLNSYEEAAVRLGIAIDRDAAARIEKANDAFLRLKLAMSGVANEISVALAPAVTFISKVITPVVRATGSWAVGLLAVTSAVGGIVLIAGKMAKAIIDIRKAIDMWRNSQIALLAVSGPKGWAILAGAVVATGGAIYAFNSTLDTQNQKLTQAAEHAKVAADAARDYGSAVAFVKPDAGRKTENESVQQELDRLRQRNRILEIGEEAYRREQIIKDGITKTEAYNLRILREKNAELERQKDIEQQARNERLAELQAHRQRVVSNMQRAQQIPQKQKIQIELPPSITQGSREEYKRLVEQQTKNRKEHLERMVLARQQKAAQERAAKAAEMGNVILERIDAEIANLQGATPV